MDTTNASEFDQRAFAASAAALVASHLMSDTVWQTYFPELPRRQPELRTVLIDLHGLALSGKAPNLTAARDMVARRFEITANTANEWLRLLQDLGLLVRLPGSKRSELHIVPSQQAKTGLYKVGQDYLICVGQVVVQLRHAIKHTEVDPEELEWLSEIKRALETDITDYQTMVGEKAKSNQT